MPSMREREDEVPTSHSINLIGYRIFLVMHATTFCEELTENRLEGKHLVYAGGLSQQSNGPP